MHRAPRGRRARQKSSSKEQEQAEDSKSTAASDEKTSNAAGKKRKPPQQSSAASREEKKLGTSIGFGVAMYPSANVKAPTDKKSNYIYVADKDLLPPKPLASSRVNHRLYQAAIPPMLSEEERRAEREQEYDPREGTLIENPKEECELLDGDDHSFFFDDEL